jgi:membrane-associated protease RseP (regulator of RpoE activity)
MNGSTFPRILRWSFVLAAFASAPIWAADPQDSTRGEQKTQGEEKAKPGSDDKPKAPALNRHHHGTYLGVVVTEVDPAIAAQLPDVLHEHEGVLVEVVAENSPAAKAGIKVHDILLNYDDQKLLSSEQLVKLARHDKPGREVTLGLIRAGKQETVKATLAELPRREGGMARHQRRHLWPTIREWERTGRWPAARQQPAWTNFDSMTLKKLDKNVFHASIKHTDAQGKMQSHEFEGTLDEIKKKIEADNDMTPDERMHLLRSLNLHSGPAIPLDAFPDGESTDF